MSTTNQSPTPIASFVHEWEADVLVNQLQSRGIQAQKLGGTISGFRAEVPSEVKVVVPLANVEQAKLCIAELDEVEETDWSQIDVGDPTDPVVVTADDDERSEVGRSVERTLFTLLAFAGIVFAMLCVIWTLLSRK